MTCQDICEFLDAYIDRELDAIAASQFERHLNECPTCRATYDRYRQLHQTVGSEMQYFRAPQEFEQRLRDRLHTPAAPQEEKVRGRWFRRAPYWATAASLAAVVLLTLLLSQMLWHRPASELLAEQVVSSHIRSLQANHLSDVISTDQHTVKPWFSGRIDFAPVVKDLSANGFPLVGGRLDYLDDHPVAALVYKRRQHTINLFLWPSTSGNSNPRSFSIRGYNVTAWTFSHMTYWAVSDVNAADLNEFAHELKEQK
jgi:anti-sigma factor (TIGR02949 family)